MLVCKFVNIINMSWAGRSDCQDKINLDLVLQKEDIDIVKNSETPHGHSLTVECY